MIDQKPLVPLLAHTNLDCLPQQKDSTCLQLITFCQQRWPNKKQITGDLSQYCSVRSELSLHDVLILSGQCILVCGTCTKRHSTRSTVDTKGFSGVAFAYPHLSGGLAYLVKNCPECAKASVPHRQPMIGSLLRSHPWEKVASDLFELNGKVYLLVVDDFSRYLEIETLHHFNVYHSYTEGHFRKTWHTISPSQ